MEVFIIRHGESEGNSRGIHQGWGDFPLTDIGRVQAIKTYNKLKNISFDQVYSSNSLRAIETAKIVFPENTIAATDKLREINCGELSGLTWQQATEKYGGLYSQMKEQYDFRPFKGERLIELEERAINFLNTEINRIQPLSKIAIVSHGGPIKAIFSHILKTNFLQLEVNFGNCSISVIHKANNRWNIKMLNNEEYIKGID